MSLLDQKIAELEGCLLVIQEALISAQAEDTRLRGAIKRWYDANYGWPPFGYDMEVRCAHAKALEDAETELCDIVAKMTEPAKESK